MLHTALHSYRCLRKERQMLLHEGCPNTGAIEWTAPARPGESQGGSLRPAVQWRCSSMPACCSTVLQRRVLYVSPKGPCFKVTCLPFLSSPSVLARRIDVWMEGNRLPVSHASARSFVSLQARVARIHLLRLRKELVPKCFL